jgi:hypothetical protein
MPPENCFEHNECKSRIARAEADIQRIYEMNAALKDALSSVKVSVAWIVGAISACSTILQVALK